MTIGIIDDDLIYKFVTRTMISRTSPDIKIIELKDGQDAIEFMIQNKDQPSHLPDMILLDINMPRLNGWQFLAELRNSNIPSYHPSIYMVSSSIDIEDITAANAHAEIIRYLSKPIPTETLREIIAETNERL